MKGKSFLFGKLDNFSLIFTLALLGLLNLIKQMGGLT